MHLTPIFNTHKTQTDSPGEFSRSSPLVSHLCVQQSRLLSLDLILNSQIGPCFQLAVALQEKKTPTGPHICVYF